MGDDPALALIRIGAAPAPWPGDALADEAMAGAQQPTVSVVSEAPAVPPIRDSAGRLCHLTVEPPSPGQSGNNEKAEERG